MDTQKEERLTKLSNLGKGAKISGVDYKDYLDVETGEVKRFKVTAEHDSTVKAKIPSHKIPIKTKDFTQIYHNELRRLRANKILTYDEFAILYAAIENVAWEDNNVYNDKGQLMSISGFARLIGKDNDFVTKVLQSLVAKGFITLTTKGKANTISVKRTIGWQGRTNEENITSQPKSSQRSETSDIQDNTKIEDVITKPQNAPLLPLPTVIITAANGNTNDEVESEVEESSLQSITAANGNSTEDSALETVEIEEAIDETVNDEEDSAAITPDPYAAVYERRNAYAIAKAMIEEGKREEAKDLLLKYDMTLAITALRL